MEKKVFQLTEKYRITLAQITRHHLVQAIADTGNSSIASLRPTEKDRPGMTHQVALQSIASYAEQWAKYEEANGRLLLTAGIGAAWRRASIDMDDDEFESERAGVLVCGKRLGLSVSEPPSDSDMGDLALQIIHFLVGEEAVVDLGKWMWKGAGLLDSEAVEAERKSQESNSERATPGGRKRRNKAENPG